MPKDDRWSRLSRFVRHKWWQLFGEKAVSAVPSLDDTAKAEFVRRLDQSKSYLEFGSGGSTIQAARRGVSTVTVENDAYFARAVQQAIPGCSTIRWVVVDIGLIEKWGRPLSYRPTRRRIARWQSYCTAAFEQIDTAGFPDFILVDGRFRVGCVLESARQAHERSVHLTVMLDDYFPKRVAVYGMIRSFLGDPVVLGRAALWDLAPGEFVRVPTEQDVRAAVLDPE